MKRYVILLMGLFLLTTATQAGRPRKVVKKKTAKKEVKVEDPRIQQMLAATQKVMFIDSMVVDKRHFISRIPLSADAGLLEQTDSLGQFTNELKDHRLTAYFDKKDSCIHIAQSDYIANQWTAPVRVGGISDSSANYPFLMPDGVTFYFAQKGEQSIGGYDIFVTRYDPETGSFLKAENIGMPFSSTANDYLYAIDEVNNLGYFVTDRRQPAGKVCIYVFIPNETRKSYQSEAGEDMTVVTTDYQSAGRGCGSNQWESEAGKNLMFSILLHPKVSAKDQFILSMANALALKDVLDSYTDGIKIKWPNDIYWNDKKIGGTLIETSLQGAEIKDFIIGTGINVNQQEFHSDAPNPVSLIQIIGCETNRDEMLEKIVARWEYYYNKVETGDWHSIRSKYRSALYRRGEVHDYRYPDGTMERMTLVDVTDDGHLLLLCGRELLSFAFKEIQFVVD